MTVVLTRAICWRIERRDGVTIGLTDHDRDLVVDGVVYGASPGMATTAIQRSDGLDADTMDVTGALASSAITTRDLVDGRWDAARVVLFAVDWTTGAVVAYLGEGTIGAVELTREGFGAELRGAAAALAAAVVETTSAGCRATLGDRRCRVAMAGRRRFARGTAAGDVLTVDATAPAGAYAGGIVRWFGGANAGLESAVAASDGAVLTLRHPPAHDVPMPVLVELIEGCDRRFETCRDRFGNAVNFRGEPFLPGLDLLTRYPGE